MLYLRLMLRTSFELPNLLPFIQKKYWQHFMVHYPTLWVVFLVSYTHYYSSSFKNYSEPLPHQSVSGNLGRVDYITEFEYDLFIRPDTCNPRFRVWFNFTVENVKADQVKVYSVSSHIKIARQVIVVNNYIQKLSLWFQMLLVVYRLIIIK